MKSITILSALIFLWIIPSHTALAQQRWERLGTRTVDWGLDRDIIPVTWKDGWFDAVRIEVHGGALNMHKCIIHFENGQQDDVEIRQLFTRRSSSRVIDLPGNKRRIEKIVFWYDTKNRARSKAVVTVWGRH
jgi:hypothetical protein